MVDNLQAACKTVQTKHVISETAGKQTNMVVQVDKKQADKKRKHIFSSFFEFYMWLGGRQSSRRGSKV